MTVRCLALLVALVLPTVLLAEPNAGSVVQRALAAADQDHDGKLSLQEYLPLDVQAAHHGEEHFRESDRDHDGFLSLPELELALQKQTWFVILSEGVTACFTRLDVDGNGRLDPAEYRKISRMGHHAEQHFSGADTNHDGSLSLEEFKAHAESKLKPLEARPGSH